MSWVRIDDRYPQHPKILAAGPDAMALDVAGMCYAAAQETDGRIPWPALTMLVPSLTPARARAAVARLVQVGRWEPVDGGWSIHDFLTYNPSAEERRARREENAERVRRHRTKKRDGNALQQDKRNAVSNGTPRPRPPKDGDGPRPLSETAPPSPAKDAGSAVSDPPAPSAEAGPAGTGDPGQNGGQVVALHAVPPDAAAALAELRASMTRQSIAARDAEAARLRDLLGPAATEQPQDKVEEA